jgi:hypothetical protein
MKTSLKKQFENPFDDASQDITQKTQAAMNLVNAASALGVLDRLLLVLSRCCGIVFGNADALPKPGEEVEEKWHGKDREEFPCTNQDDTGKTGESRSETLSRESDLISTMIRKRKPGRATKSS